MIKNAYIVFRVFHIGGKVFQILYKINYIFESLLFSNIFQQGEIQGDGLMILPSKHFTRITRGDGADLGFLHLKTSRKRKSQLWIFVIVESTCTLRDLVHPGSEAHPMFRFSCRWF